MGLISGVWEKRATSTLKNPASWLADMFSYSRSSAGITVNEQTALTNTAVWACIRVISESVASLPLILYEKLPDRGKRRAENHPLFPVLRNQPNPEMSAFTFWETYVAHLLLYGNAYAEIEYNQGGGVRALWPLAPWMVQPQRADGVYGALIYRVTTPDGSRTLPPERVLHTPGLSFDGIVGMSPIEWHREAIGLGLAAEQFGAKFFGNGAQLSGILEHPGQLSLNAQKNLRESFESTYQGLSNAHRLMILEEGMKYTRIGIPPNDAQFLETRKFQVNEIARIFRVPPHMIADLERATFSNIEHQSLEFVKYTLSPWIIRLEQAIKMKLLSLTDDRNYFAEFLVDGLLRGDIKTRYEAYAVARQNGWMSANDIRELENQNPIPAEEGGDIYLVNGNMVSIDQAGQQQTPNPMGGGDNNDASGETGLPTDGSQDG